MKKTIPLLAAFTLCGCANNQQRTIALEDASAHPDLHAFVEKANAVADAVLTDFNSSERSKQKGGPFSLSDYRVSLDEEEFDGRPYVHISYQLTKAVDFRGHPQHFSVWVFKDTGETRLYRGR